MSVKLYYTLLSPPSRAVILTLKSLNIPHTLCDVNLFSGEHKSEDFMKMNPQHTVPVLDDNGFIVLDSHVINAYLVTKYGKDDKLYPKEARARSIVDHRLYFDTGEMFPVGKNTIVGIKRKNITSITSDIQASFEDCYEKLEKFLTKQYVAGDELTIADFSVITTVTALNILVPIKKDKYPLIHSYVNRCKTNMSHYDINERGIKALRSMFETMGFPLPPHDGI